MTSPQVAELDRPGSESSAGKTDWRRRRAWWVIPAWLRSLKSLLIAQLLLGVGIVVWVQPALQQSERQQRQAVYVKLRSLALDFNIRRGPSQVARGRHVYSWRVRHIESLKRWDLSKAVTAADQHPTLAGSRDEFVSLTDRYTSPRCPSSLGTGKTAFAAIVGPDTVIQADRVVDLELISGRADQVGMLMELTTSDIDWWEPREVTVEEAIAMIRTCPHRSGLMVAMASGRVVCIPQTTSTDELRKLFSTVAGRPQIDYRNP